MRPRISIRPGFAFKSRIRLFTVLSQWLEIDFAGDERNLAADFAGEVCFVGQGEEPPPPCARRRLILGAGCSAAGAKAVTFADSHEVHFALRNRKFTEAVGALREDAAGEVLARSGTGPVWARRRGVSDVADFVSDDVPEIPENSTLHDQLRSGSSLGLIALIDFLRKASGAGAWESPATRACLMFDDPNLRSVRYGFIDFEALAKHAAEHNYHAAMATVPLDGWALNCEAVALFRDRSDRLSLLVHGNNHTHMELAQPYSETARASLVAQSLKRIARLEEKVQFSIPRVMAAPHGACSEVMADELLRQGFEAACISAGSLRAHNREKVWPATFGLEPAEFLASGLPIIPRFRLRRDCREQIVIAAFLGQPVVPVGHHQDLAEGLDVLRSVSADVNSLEGVVWGNMLQIARGNFKSRRRGNCLQLRTYAREVELEVTGEVEAIQVEQAWSTSGAEPASLEVRFGSQDEGWLRCEENEFAWPKDQAACRTIQIRWVLRKTLDYREVPLPPIRAWPICRRLLSEFRDRIRPIGYSFRS